METTENCLIKQHLLHMKASPSSSNSTTELVSFFYLLRKVLTNLLNNIGEDKDKTIQKDKCIIIGELINTQTVKDFLKLLGFNEEGEEAYIFDPSDENLRKIEKCLELLYVFTNEKEDSANSCDMSDEEVTLANFRFSSRKPKSLCEIREPRKKFEEKQRRDSLKQRMMQKHFDKENNSKEMLQMQARKKLSSVLFNENGFFHQASTTKNTKKTAAKSFLNEFFHKYDGNIMDKKFKFPMRSLNDVN